MNALWLTRISAYKSSPLALASARRLIGFKIGRQDALLKRYQAKRITYDLDTAQSMQEVLLEEARAAKEFWAVFRGELPVYGSFWGRKPGAGDVVNCLLDIGYHHLTTIVKKSLEQHQVPADLGLLHIAKNTDSAPLAYDLVELFRSDIVDAEVLRYLHLKKEPLEGVRDEVPHFLHGVNRRLEHKHYLRDFKQCHTYRYYMELQILKFIKAVNHREIFEPVQLPTRHDTRCLTATSLMLDSSQTRSSISDEK